MWWLWQRASRSQVAQRCSDPAAAPSRAWRRGFSSASALALSWARWPTIRTAAGARSSARSAAGLPARRSAPTWIARSATSRKTWARRSSPARRASKRCPTTWCGSMTSHTAFDTDSVNIKPAFHSTLDKLADVVVRYGKTSLTIVGHTDNVGSNQYNQKLSERRAVSVAQYFESRHVSPLRLATLGKGEGEPVASNNTESGRSANRRVEIYVEPIVGG